MNQIKVMEMVRDNPEIVQRGREQMASVLSRSASDPEFRNELLSDSRSALSRHLGSEIPAGANIAFVESAPGTVTLVLPDPISATGQLDDAELEAVSGGVVLELIALGVVAASYYWLGDQMNN